MWKHPYIAIFPHVEEILQKTAWAYMVETSLYRDVST